MDAVREAELIKSFQSGNKEAFGLLYDRYLKQIYNFVYYKTHHKETAEDLTEVIFLKAYRGITTFQIDKGTFQAWLYKIARHTIIDHYRATKFTVNIEDAWDIGSTEDVAKDTENRIQISEIQEYLKGLPSEQRDIIIMRVWQEMSYAEIAEALGKSEASCKMSFSRSIKKLREAFPDAVLALLLLFVMNK